MRQNSRTTLYALAIAFLVGLATAQTTTIDMSLPGLENNNDRKHPVQASLIAVNDTTTTLRLNCAGGLYCGSDFFVNGLTLTRAPSTMHFSHSGINGSCSITPETASSTVAQEKYDCFVSSVGNKTVAGKPSYWAIMGTVSSTHTMAVTITAGAEKLPRPSTTSTAATSVPTNEASARRANGVLAGFAAGAVLSVGVLFS